jgi:multidrug efflux pump subunit AcrB
MLWKKLCNNCSRSVGAVSRVGGATREMSIVLDPGKLQALGISAAEVSRRLRLTLGNGDARLVVNGSPRAVPKSARSLGYAISPTTVTRLTGSERPSCT